MVWNCLLGNLQDQEIDVHNFRGFLKTYCVCLFFSLSVCYTMLIVALQVL